MRVNRHAMVAVVGATALLGGGGAALASGPGSDRGARCEKMLEKVAERRGVSVAELESQVKERLRARVDAALEAGRISSERAAKLKERISAGTLCQGVRGQGVRGQGVRDKGVRAVKTGHARHGSHGMFKAAAQFLELDRAALKAQLPGNSLASIALKQGKSVEALEAAALAPARVRLAGAVASGRITQGQADRVLERLERVASRLVTRTFPAK